MANHIHNPFVLPGLGQGGDAGQNPLLASMEMMRQAWQGLASSGALSSMAAPMSLDDLDRRIADLHTVENWLRMNLSMLTSTIQGLEVQRATIATLKSFAVSSSGQAETRSGPSPLEVVLGIRPAGDGDGEPSPKASASAASPGAGAASAQPGAVGAAPATGSGAPNTQQAGKSSEGAAAGQQAQPGADIPAVAAGWWNMLQQQFDTLAAATAATLQSAEAMQSAAAQSQAQGQSAPKPASADSSFKPAPAKSRASKTAAKSAAKSAPRKRAAAKKASQ